MYFICILTCKLMLIMSYVYLIIIKKYLNLIEQFQVKKMEFILNIFNFKQIKIKLKTKLINIFIRHVKYKLEYFYDIIYFI